MDMKTILRQRVMVNVLMVLGITAWMTLGVVANVVMAQTTTEAPPVTSAPAPEEPHQQPLRLLPKD